MAEQKKTYSQTSQANQGKKVLTIGVPLVIVGAILLALFIAWWQPTQSANSFKANFPAKLELANELVSEVQENSDAVVARYDSLYASKADTVALYARTKSGFGYSQSEIQELFDTLSVDALAAVDADGAVVAQCGTLSGFESDIAKAAKSAIANNGSCDAFTVEKGTSSLRLYAAAVDGTHAIVVAKQPSEIEASVESLASVSDELKDVSVGGTGFVLAVDGDGIVRHHADTSLIGKTASELGLTEAQLKDDYVGDTTINGERYLSQTCSCGTYTLICAMPYEELNSFTATYIAIGVVVYLIGASILLAFIYFTCTDRRRKAEAGKGSSVSRKALPVGVGCLIFVLAASLYVSTLVELSSMMVSNDNHAQAASDEIEAADTTISNIDSEATGYVEQKAQLTSYILPRLDQSQLTRAFMVDLREALACDCVWYFDMNGDTIASDNDFWGYRLSEDEDSFSYQFREVLQGRKSEVVAVSSQATGDWQVTKYVGLVVQDDSLRTIGMVEIGSDQTLVTKMKSSLSLSSILHTVQPGNNAFAFAINTDSGKFTYYPDSNLVGELASDYGIPETSQEAGFSDFLTINGETYLCASVSVDGEYVYVATPASVVTDLAVPNAVATTLFSLIWFLVLVFVAAPRSRKGEGEAVPEGDRDQGELFDDEVADVTVDGRVKRTTAAVSRWNMRGVSWENRTPGQKVSAICGAIFTILALAFLVMALFSDSLFSKSSLFHYILSGSWQPGMNMFAITRCVMVVLVAYAAVDIVRRLLQWFAESMTAKGETICRLLDNVLKFAFWIAMIYFCMGTLGADTSVLLTSAGILTLVVGLGANSLITDIIAGLFIVFEGEFQVGDIVTIGDFRGTVQEIGVRTTKIKGGDNNVKVFANRNVSGVLNMTKDLSSVSCTFDFPSTLSLERMEVLLANELPKLKKALPAIVEGPYYRGVAEMGDPVKLQVVAKCREADRGQLERDLKREIRLVAERYLLGPDAQANAIERIAAERFSDQQSEAARDIHLDSDN